MTNHFSRRHSPARANLDRIRHQANRRREALSRQGLSTYVMGHKAGWNAIVCLCCGTASIGQQDIASKYCSFCHQFHSEEKQPTSIDAGAPALTMQQLGAMQGRNEERKRFAYTDLERQATQDIDEAIAEIIRLRSLLEHLKGSGGFPPGMIELPPVRGDRRC